MAAQTTTQTMTSAAYLRPGDRVYVNIGGNTPEWLTVSSATPRGDLTYAVAVETDGGPVELDRPTYWVERGTTATATRPARCKRCRRALKNTRSIAAGYGPGCARIVRAELDGYSPTQTVKAVRLLEEGRVARIPSRHFRLYAIQGTYTTYQSDGIDCTCPGARERGTCYHAQAVRLHLAAA